MSTRPSLAERKSVVERKSMAEAGKPVQDAEMKEKLDLLEAKLLEMERNEVLRQSSANSQNLKEIVLSIPDQTKNDRKISTRSNLVVPSPRGSQREKTPTGSVRSSNVYSNHVETGERAKSIDRVSEKKNIHSHSFSEKKLSRIDENRGRNIRSQNADQIERLENRKQQIITFLKTRLKNIFIFYTSFGDRCNASLLKSNKFHKMLVDANIREGVDPTKLDLLFVSENKHKANMNFETFLNMIPSLAMLKYPGVNQGEAISNLVERHFLPLYNNIMRETDLGEEEGKLKYPIDLQTLLVLKFVSPVLKKIYQVYFPWEPKCSQPETDITHRSENALFQFLREYDISPNIVTRSTAFFLYNQIISTDTKELTCNTEYPNIVAFLHEDIGTVFTISRFFAYLIRISSDLYDILAYDQPELTNLKRAEKFLLTLHKMELSDGFRNLEKKTFTTHNSKTSLILPEEVLEMIFSGSYNDLSPEKNSKENSFINRASHQKSFNESVHSGVSLSKYPREDTVLYTSPQLKLTRTMVEDLNFNLGILSAYEPFLEALKRIFETYCSMGEPMNTTKLKSIKFQKLLREAQVFPNTRFNQTDADMIFTKLTGSKMMKKMKDKVHYDLKVKSPKLSFDPHLKKQEFSAVGKMLFEHFIKAIEMIAEKLFPEEPPESSIPKTVEFYFLKLDTQSYDELNDRAIGNYHVELLMRILSDSQIEGLIRLLHRSIGIYYNYYADSHSFIDFNSYMKFAKDFEIFPYLLPKSRLMRIFYSLASLFENSQQNVLQKTTDGNKNLNVSRTADKSKFSGSGVIDQNLFVESLALCAMEIQYGETNVKDVEKILMLLEKINQSDGSKKIQKELGHTRSPLGNQWDILHSIRKNFPDVYGEEEGLRKSTKRKNFEDVIGENFLKMKFNQNI